MDLRQCGMLVMEESRADTHPPKRVDGLPFGVLCLNRGGVALTTVPISSPSLGRVKWKGISAKETYSMTI